MLYFEGDQHHTLRILRAVKNRFGSTNEIGIFVMESTGLEEVSNPSELLLGERSNPVAGSIVAATLEGSRPVLVEIQALLTDTSFGVPRRMATGVDQNRVAMLMAVLEKRAGLFLGQQDAYVNVVGGLRISEPAADLAIALAIVSGYRNLPVNRRMVAIGEIGLTGEVRPVSQVEIRMKEAEKLGFDSCIIPKGNAKKLRADYALTIHTVDTVADAVHCAVGR